MSLELENFISEEYNSATFEESTWRKKVKELSDENFNLKKKVMRLNNMLNNHKHVKDIFASHEKLVIKSRDMGQKIKEMGDSARVRKANNIKAHEEKKWIIERCKTVLSIEEQDKIFNHIDSPFNDWKAMLGRELNR